jgi:hypothetical protein
VANWYNIETLTASPSQINWLLTVSLFTVFSVVYIEGTKRFMPKRKSFFPAHPYSLLSTDLQS